MGPTQYGILCSIRRPDQSIRMNVDPKPTNSGRPRSTKRPPVMKDTLQTVSKDEDRVKVQNPQTQRKEHAP